MSALTTAQVSYFMHWLPMIAARNHYSTASLIATLKNALGGKPDEDDDSPPVKLERLFRPEEELPYFAWMHEPRSGLTVGAARDLIAAWDSLPGWAQDVAPIVEARRIAA